jgi:Zn-dependent protease/predicted transcriptional regulator
VNETLRLGHVAGIRIGVNWTVLVIFGLVFLGLSAGRFPLSHPDEAPWAYVTAGGVAAVVFFLSLLAHEMAHALVAQRNGIRVEGITLWLFGGVAKLLDEATDPGTDLRVAAVGPLVSLGLGATFGLLALGAGAIGFEGLAVGALWWLALINVVLAAFNLVPASPLDGGRILRAVLWARHGDRTRAAVTASRAGRSFGLTLVALGLVVLVTVPGIGGLWFMLIGWFIMTAASAEEQHARLRHTLEGVRVGDVMTPDPVSVPGSLSVERLVSDYVWHYRFSSFPVVDATGRPTGLVTLNRIKEVPADERPRVSVQRISCTLAEVPQTSPDRPLAELFRMLDGASDGRILVLEEGRVVGIVSPTDITRSLELADLQRPAERSHL